MNRFVSSSLMAAASLTIFLVPAMAAPPASNKEAEALVKQGNEFQRNGELREALKAYRQAAKAGSPDGAFAAGEMLVDAGRNSRGRERILKLAEGISDLYYAATNRLPRACAELSGVLRSGVGVKTNLVAAYAWMVLAAEKNHAYKADLDQLVIRMKPAEIRQAQDLAHDYSQGNWPPNLVRPVDEGDPRLKIKGITVGGRESLVILNRDTFTKGDTLDVTPEGPGGRPGSGTLTVTCLEIGSDYVLVSVAGEPHLKLLSSSDLLSEP